MSKLGNLSALTSPDNSEQSLEQKFNLLLTALRRLEQSVLQMEGNVANVRQNNQTVLDHGDLRGLAYPAGHTGFASAAEVSDHINAADPHSQYLTEGEGDSLYEASGTMLVHVAELDPHPQYLTQAEANVLYAFSGFHFTAGSGLIEVSGQYHIQVGSGLYLQDDLLGVNLQLLSTLYQASGLYELSGTSYTKAESDARFEVSGTMVDHLGHPDPHPQYLTETEANILYALSGLNLTAGSGLNGGGFLSADRRFDITGGFGIFVSQSGIAVNQTILDARYALSGSAGATPTLQQVIAAGATATSTPVLANTTTALQIGNGAAGIDYRILFEGQTSDGEIVWMEDERSMNLRTDGSAYFEYPGTTAAWTINAIADQAFEGREGMSAWIKATADQSYMYGFFGGVYDEGSSAKNLAGAIGAAGWNYFTGTNARTVNVAMGGQFVNDNSGSNLTVNNAIGVQAGAFFLSSAPIGGTNYYAFYGMNPGAPGTCLNNYGLYLEAMTAGTNNYGVYSVSRIHTDEQVECKYLDLQVVNVSGLVPAQAGNVGFSNGAGGVASGLVWHDGSQWRPVAADNISVSREFLATPSGTYYLFGSTNYGVAMPKRGSITGLSVSVGGFTAISTSGYWRLTVHKNAAATDAKAAVLLHPGPHPDADKGVGYANFAPGQITFNAGDNVQIHVTAVSGLDGSQVQGNWLLKCELLDS